jgi:hypothetical protein
MEYEIIDIKDETNGCMVRKSARKITKHLAVAYTNEKYGDRTLKIYSIQAHREAIPHRIATYQDAVDIAKLLFEVYGDYWDIHDHDDWKQADIPQIARLSVPDGNRFFVSLKSLEDRDIITMQDLQNALDKSNE